MICKKVSLNQNSCDQAKTLTWRVAKLRWFHNIEWLQREQSQNNIAITEPQDRNTLDNNKIKDATVTAKEEWPHCTGFVQRLKVKLHEMSVIAVCNGSILIITLAKERIKLALILYKSHAIYGSKG